VTVAAACYPEGHVDCRDLARDLDHLAGKVRAGVDFLITQLFFDNEHYFRFVERARAAGIGVPIVPGIMPIGNVAQIERFTKMCGATIPRVLFAELDKRRDDPAAVAALGVAQATAQCVELLRGGAPGIHFYTLNQSPATRVILTALKAARLA
jgi:methylenetetrahydrofolate reductase (NADPH)